MLEARDLTPGTLVIVSTQNQFDESLNDPELLKLQSFFNDEVYSPISEKKLNNQQDLLVDIRDAVPIDWNLGPIKSGSVLKLSFDMDSLDLELEIKSTGEAVYAIYGGNVLDSFTVAINGTFWPTDEIELIGEPPTIAFLPGSNRTRLANLWATVKKDLELKINEIQMVVAKETSLFAIEGLNKSIRSTLGQAIHFFNFSSYGENNINVKNYGDIEKQFDYFVNNPSPNSYDLRDIAVKEIYLALLEISELKRDVDKYVEASKKASFISWAVNASETDIPDAVVQATRSAANTANQLENEKITQVASIIAEICNTNPILFRLYSTGYVDLVADIEAYSRNGDIDRRFVILKGNLGLKLFIKALFKKSIDSANQLKMELKENPKGIWKFPHLVTAYLEKMAIDPGTFAYAATEAELAKHEELSSLQKASMASSTVELYSLAIGTSEVPPLAATIAIAATILGAMSAVIEEYEIWSKRDASWTDLDPGKSLASDPGVVWTVLNVCFTILDLWGIKQPISAIKSGALK